MPNLGSLQLLVVVLAATTWASTCPTLNTPKLCGSESVSVLFSPAPYHELTPLYR
jgi:hypothetical protein